MGVYCQGNCLSVLSPTNACVPELNCNPYVLRFSDLKMWMFCPKDGWDWTGDEHSRALKNERRNSTTQSTGTSHNKEQSAALGNLREQAGRNRYSVVERKATHVLAHLSSSNSFHLLNSRARSTQETQGWYQKNPPRTTASLAMQPACNDAA